MKEIVQKEDSVLRQTAKPVLESEINTSKIKKILADMKEALDKEEDGVAIAASQIGVSLRIFIVSGKIFSNPETGVKPAPEGKVEHLVFINPEITKTSKKKSWIPEGCLSVRWTYGEVKRAENVTVRALDENGKSFVRGSGGLLAQIFQHETDHLDGTLFTDKARNLEEVKPEENK